MLSGCFYEFSNFHHFSESDFEAETRVHGKRLEFKNNSTNDHVQGQIDLRDFNDKEDSEIGSSSTDTELNNTATLEQGIIDGEICGQEELEEDVTDKDNNHTGNKLATRTEFTHNIIKTKQLLQLCKNNIAHVLASDESP